jgi:hypothetical protein
MPQAAPLEEQMSVNSVACSAELKIVLGEE